MKFSVRASVLLGCVLLGSFGFAANNSASGFDSTFPARPTVKRPMIIPKPPKLNVKAYVLMDANTGKIIASKNPNERMPMASLTKLMSMYIISNALSTGQIHLDDTVHISKTAWKMGGSRMFVKAGSDVPVQELIQGIVVASGNDATTAMAEFVGDGSQENFVAMMNQAAQALKLQNSHFMNPTGLPDDEHYSTAFDLATLTRALILHFPEHYHWYNHKWFKYNNIKQPNRNRLLWRDESVDGLKTGHTNSAGFCLISSAKREDMRLISVVLGARSDNARASKSQSLLNYGFRYFRSPMLYTKGQPVTHARIYYGDKKKIAFGVAHDFHVTLPVHENEKYKVTVKLRENLAAPITKGNVYGELFVGIGGKPLGSVPLVALEDDPVGGIFTRTKDSIVKFLGM